MSRKKTVLVTGSSGLIGTTLMDALAVAGYNAIGLDVAQPKVNSPTLRLHHVDLCDAKKLRQLMCEVRPDFVIHLAARTDLLGRSVADYQANTVGVRNLAESIETCGSVQRTICASTQLVCRVGYHPTHDQDYAPSTFYGESKVETERIAREAMPGEWCLVRPTTIWGPWMSPHYQRFLNMLRRGLYVHVGDGTRLKSYGYVGNTAHQLIGLLEAASENIHRKMFYLADYEPLSLRDWTEALSRELGGPKIRTLPLGLAQAAGKVGDRIVAAGLASFPFTSFRLNNVLADNVFDMSATAAVIPTLPFSVEDGVRSTVSWYRRHVLLGPPKG